MKRWQTGALVLAALTFVGASGVRPRRDPVFWRGVASFRDPLGARVRQLTLTDPFGGDQQTPYWHQNLAVDADRILLVNVSREGAEYTTLNVRTGQRALAAARGTANGEYVGGRALYGFHHASAAKSWLGRLDLDTFTWEHYVRRGSSDKFEGAVAVNASADRLVWRERDAAGSVHVRAYDRRTDVTTTLYRGADAIEHMVFSPVDRDLFFYINQSAGMNVRRLGLGHVPTGRMEPISPEGGYWAANFALADPFWSHTGALTSDVLWHPEALPGSYSLARFDLGSMAADGFARVRAGAQARWVLPVASRNQHVNPTSFPGWFVGDGDPQGIFGGWPFVSLVYIPEPGGTIRVYPLASHRGALPHAKAVPNTHALPDGDALVATWRYDAASGRDSSANVYLIEVPPGLRRAMRSDRAPTSAAGIPLHFR